MRRVVESARLALLALVGYGRGLHTTPGRALRPQKRVHRGKVMLITGITIHESVSEHVEGAKGRDPEDILAARNLSVHEVIQTPDDGASDVVVTAHVPVELGAIHAGTYHNLPDVALELETRYRPADGDRAIARVGAPLTGTNDVLVGVWVWRPKGAKHRLYRVPPIAQLEALWVRVGVHCAAQGIPREFPCVDPAKGFRWGRHAGHEAPGITAHANWHHADGLFPVCYCWLRRLGHAPVAAYRHAVAMGGSGQRWTPAPVVWAADAEGIG
jgi:hypothetical protein